jgi:hypothetical protein
MKAAISIPTKVMDVLKCIEHNEDLKKFGENFKKCPGKFPKWIPVETRHDSPVKPQCISETQLFHHQTKPNLV